MHSKWNNSQTCSCALWPTKRYARIDFVVKIVMQLVQTVEVTRAQNISIYYVNIKPMSRFIAGSPTGALCRRIVWCPINHGREQLFGSLASINIPILKKPFAKNRFVHEGSYRLTYSLCIHITIKCLFWH
jgi:hypothetical protein